MVVYGLVHFISGIPSIAKVNDLDVELAVKEDVLALDIAMGDSFGVDIFEGLYELFEYSSCHFF